jgi:hypothetical protein
MIKTVGDLKKALHGLADRVEIVALMRSKDGEKEHPGGYIHSVNEWEEGIVILVEPYTERRREALRVKLDVEVEFMQDCDVPLSQEPAMKDAVAAFVRGKLTGSDDLTKTPRVDGIGIIQSVSAMPKEDK